MDRLETMACELECVVGGRKDCESTLHLRCRLESTHLEFSLPGVLAGHLGSLVLVLPGSMSSRRAEFPAGRRIASTPVVDQPPRPSPLPLEKLVEKALGGSRVTTARDQNIRDVAVLIHRHPKMAAFRTDRDEDLIHMLDIAQPAMLTAQVPSKGGTELATLHSDRLVGDCGAALGEKVFAIPGAESEPMTERHGVTDDLGWEAVASIEGFSRSRIPHGRHLDSTGREVAKGAGGSGERVDGGRLRLPESVFAEYGVSEREQPA